MNTNEFDARFDRLVDGELSADEYQALLAALDDEPGGWRRCAFAFLEAQALAGELGQIRRSLDLSAASRPSLREGAWRQPTEANQWNATEGVPYRRPRWFELHTLFAIALSFLFAFTLGTLAPRFFAVRPQEPGFAGNNPSAPQVASAGQAGGGGDVRHEAFRPVGNVRLVMDGPAGGAAESGDVPVFDVGADLESFLSQGRPALPPDLVELLRQRGHDVVRQEQYVPAQLDDGRQVIVPVERYQITPVSRRAY